MNGAQHAQMWVHFNRLGLGGQSERQDRLAICSALAGRPVPSITTLSEGEAGSLLLVFRGCRARPDLDIAARNAVVNHRIAELRLRIAELDRQGRQLASLPPLTVQLGEADRSVGDILADAGSPGEQSARASCIAWLRETLTEPKRSADLEDEAKELGYPSRTVKRARAKLGIRAEKRMDGWWAIPPGLEEGHAAI